MCIPSNPADPLTRGISSLVNYKLFPLDGERKVVISNQYVPPRGKGLAHDTNA